VDDLAEETGKRKFTVESRFDYLARTGYLTEDSELGGSVSLTDKGRQVLDFVGELRRVDGYKGLEDAKILEVQKVRPDAVIYEDAHVYEGDLTEFPNIEEGEYSHAVVRNRSRGVKYVEVLEHPFEFLEK